MPSRLLPFTSRMRSPGDSRLSDAAGLPGSRVWMYSPGAPSGVCWGEAELQRSVAPAAWGSLEGLACMVISVSTRTPAHVTVPTGPGQTQMSEQRQQSRLGEWLLHVKTPSLLSNFRDAPDKPLPQALGGPPCLPLVVTTQAGGLSTRCGPLTGGDWGCRVRQASPSRQSGPCPGQRGRAPAPPGTRSRSPQCWSCRWRGLEGVGHPRGMHNLLGARKGGLG